MDGKKNFQDLTQLPTLNENIEKLVRALNEQDWTAPVFNDHALFPYYGLAAVREGFLMIEQFSTLMFYWSLRQHHPQKEIQVIHFFKEEKMNQEAFDIIYETAPNNLFKSTRYREKIQIR